jgi:hypothetical protein
MQILTGSVAGVMATRHLPRCFQCFVESGVGRHKVLCAVMHGGTAF